jgi:hypothetical protein
LAYCTYRTKMHGIKVKIKLIKIMYCIIIWDI